MDWDGARASGRMSGSIGDIGSGLGVSSISDMFDYTSESMVKVMNDEKVDSCHRSESYIHILNLRIRVNAYCSPNPLCRI